MRKIKLLPLIPLITISCCLISNCNNTGNRITYSRKYAPLSLDDNGYGVSNNKIGEVYVSNAKLDASAFINLNDRGIIFNKTSVGKIKSFKINIADNNNCILYCGDSPLSFKHSFNLTKGNNTIDVSDKNVYYFVLQSQKDSALIKSMSFEYDSTSIPQVVDLPVININTNGVEITSKEEYVEATITSKDTGSDLDNVKAGVRLRGNSTSYYNKKPYRIKFENKQSLFGLTKAKNWVLVADYLDGSKMHNYSALKFANIVKGDTSFCPTPNHVRLILNGVDMGIYLLTEHIDEKEGRMNIAQEAIWNFTSFDQFNFMVERDNSILDDTKTVEGRDYFVIIRSAGNKEVYQLKYPTIDDFVEEVEGGEPITHETEFYTYFNWLKDYITTISDLMYSYKSDTSIYSQITDYIDTQSLALYGTIDQMFLEQDHKARSFKLYRDVSKNQLIKFGPNWDYDILVMNLPLALQDITSKPFRYYDEGIKLTGFNEQWSWYLYKDDTNGKPLFKNIWANISQSQIDNYLANLLEETNKLLPYYLIDTDKWYSNRYSCIFDNIRYNYEFIKAHITYLKNYYSVL